MKDVLYKNSKIEVRRSPINGYGVFANDDINAGETLEECYYLNISKTQIVDGLRDYVFGHVENNKKNIIVVLGYGSIYNSSNAESERNAKTKIFPKDKYISFYAMNNIKKDEEIFIYYTPRPKIKQILGKK